MESNKIRIPDKLTPPIKFAEVQPQLYRGAYPRPVNYRYLESLQLKTMVALLPQPVTLESDASLFSFCTKNQINLIHVECDGKTKDKGKKRGIPIDHDSVIRVLEILLDKQHNPIFIFCNNGGQITSLIVACLRKLGFWNSVSIFNEFVNYSSTVNHNDRYFIESFKAKLKLPIVENRVDWIWNGLSKTVIDNHPFITFIEHDKELQQENAINAIDLK
ncbi:protein tyrosine phosphatase activity protein [[Candida] boidinii]|nr:protein tyrosine phosphatase activity protein [[Candida] boidinii]OWB64166.1 protein tyrosine phosphatase activity protein [[Candida] boidinii]OWB80141.1 protein tyrosine phosphatase activity protein [[Candida] boidinii]